MYSDPLLVDPVKRNRFHPQLTDLMELALQRPDVETRRRAAYSIGRLAGEGMPGIDRLTQPLLDMLKQKQLHRVVRLEVAKALVRLDAQQAAADLLARSSQDGLDMIRIADGALSRWNHEPAFAVWMQRLGAQDTTRAARIAAIQSLGAVRHGPAAPMLKKVALDRTLDASLRLAAARALGTMIRHDLEPLAESLAGGDLPDRLVAVHMVVHHDGAAARALLLRLAQGREPAVVKVALRRLIELERTLVDDLVDQVRLAPSLAERHGGTMPNVRVVAQDSGIRLLAGGAIASRNTPQAVRLLAPMLNDDHVGVRNDVRSHLVAMDTNASLQQAIREVADQVLGGDEQASWRGVEQAALLAGMIDHEPQTPRLLELLIATSPEVRIAAAFALRRLAVPDTLAKVYQTAVLICKGIKHDMANELIVSGMSGDEPSAFDARVQAAVKTVMRQDLDTQVAQMMQMFGQMLYKPAEPLMRLHIPKHSYPVHQRAAAMWALGHLYADSGNEELAGEFAGRLADVPPTDPEAQAVRRFSAIGIGRLNAPAQADVLERFYGFEKFSVDIGGSCRWSLIRLDGKERPPLDPIVHTKTGFFLEPNEKLEEEEYLFVDQ